MNNELMHYGTPQHFVNDPNGSGRYRKGTGEHAHQRDQSLMGQYFYYKKSGEFANDTEIARAMGISTTELRKMKSVNKDEQRAADRARAIEIINKQEANGGKRNLREVARIMYDDPKKESTVRNLLNDTLNERAQITYNIASVLKENVDKKRYIDVGKGVETQLGVSSEKLGAAIKKLGEEGYHIEQIKVEQVGTGKLTTMNILVGPECTWAEVNKNRDKIRLITEFSEDNGRTMLNIEPPISVDSKRIQINYESPKDGVIELRRGVDDISLGNADYAQVRIAVDGTHYLKGMAVYSDNMPPGIDIMFNTNKHPGTPMMAPNKNDDQVLKMLKTNKDNVFGATIKNEENLKLAQRYYIDENGERKQSAINIVNEQGDWDKWSKTLASQFLSKQSVTLAKRQLEITQNEQREELDTIKSLTNPVLRQKLLDSFADDCDSKAVHLKAAALPRQASHVLLPITSLKENEIYAPNYDNGETVVLIRYPHGGKFEIPQLTVNNSNKEARSILKQAGDAVGINPAVCGKLSGADFDGDTALVIPVNNKVKIQVDNRSAFKELQTFEPKEVYKGYEGMKVMSEKYKQKEMGVVTNLINDMTLKGAPPEELVRAVKHSMVVIDAPKHKLNWKLSEQENGIAQLKKKYQAHDPGEPGGASTLISRAKSEQRVLERKELTNPSRMTAEQLADWNAGKKVWVETGRSYVNKKGETVYRTTESTKMYEARDANSLVSTPGTPMECVYAQHANVLKGMADEARRESRTTKGSTYNAEARKLYKNEVDSLNAKLDTYLLNKPLERQAQLIANKTIAVQKAANPDMDKDEIKRLKQQALAGARNKVGKKPYTIDITPREWDAIQSGAVSKSMQKELFDGADIDQIKKYATPRQQKMMTSANIARARALLAAGHTQAEVAKELGVSVSTISKNI